MGLAVPRLALMWPDVAFLVANANIPFVHARIRRPWESQILLVTVRYIALGPYVSG
jgi:hypothetical protein